MSDDQKPPGEPPEPPSGDGSPPKPNGSGRPTGSGLTPVVRATRGPGRLDPSGPRVAPDPGPDPRAARAESDAPPPRPQPPGAHPPGPRRPGDDAPIRLRRPAPRAGGPFDPTAPPPRLSLDGARITVGLLLAMVAIEVALQLGQNFPGLGPDGLRRAVFELLAFRPIQPIAVALGEAPLTELRGLFGYMILHGGILHIAFNGLAMLVLGPPLERSYGPAMYLAIFVVGGICGALGHAAWELTGYLMDPARNGQGLATYLVGASGAISALLGAQIARQTAALRRLPREFRPTQPWVHALKISAGFIAINLAIMFIDAFISGSAHIGGFLAGLAVGAVRPRVDRGRV